VGAVVISVVSLIILILWDSVLTKKHKIFGLLNGPLIAVLVGILLNYLYQTDVLPFSLLATQIVNLPVASDFQEFLGQFTAPDFSQWNNPNIYLIAFVLAVVASLETLLSVEATDKLDPNKNVTPTNRELKAQGLGNVISGVIGGLPITQVIVRSSANITFGAKSQLSAIMHGFFLLFSVILIPGLLNMIPLATLAAILFVVGFKLAKPSLFKVMYQLGWEQFAPFMATIVGILLTDLLTGIGIGMAVAIFYILRNNFRNPYHRLSDEDLAKHEHLIVLSEEVSFLNKGSILQMLNHIPENSKVIIDGTKSKSIHYDVIDIIKDFEINAKTKNITVETKGIHTRKDDLIEV
jgi:SulP family sulfate permease